MISPIYLGCDHGIFRLVDFDINLAVKSLLLIGLWEANLIKVRNDYKICQILIKLTLNNLIKSDLVKIRRFG